MKKVLFGTVLFGTVCAGIIYVSHANTYTVISYDGTSYTAVNSIGMKQKFTLNDVDGFIGVGNEVGIHVKIEKGVVTPVN